MLQEFGVLTHLQHMAWAHGESLCIYGYSDPAYPLHVHLQAPYRNANMTPDQEEYNKAMSQVRIVVEWLIGEIKTNFKFASLKSQMKIGLSAAGETYFVCGLVQNTQTCLYGNKVSEYFIIDTPELEQYFG